MSITKLQSGGISILVLLFGTIFSITIGGLVLFGVVQNQSVRRNETSQKALSMAEGGINYYRWHLAHDPDDYTDGNPQSAPSYVHEIPDPEGGTAGSFSLSITPPTPELPFTTVVSTGTAPEHPDIKRTITAQMGERSLASFAFLHNANVWFGQGTTVSGEVFSNGGIRMDGTNNSTVKSAKDTYTCGVETGCYPDTEERPGIWGQGGPQELWEYPAVPIDFDSITLDFTTMQESAENTGLYLPDSGAQGYHVVFDANGSFQLYKVTATNFYKGYSTEEGCVNLYQVISNQTLIATYQIANVPILFAEDTLWVDGVVNGHITVVAARFPIDTNNENIWIVNNLTYAAKDGNSSLGLVAQNDIIFGRDVPDSFEVNGALLAQKGRVIRHHYRKTNGPHCSTSNQATKNEITIYGSVISNQKSYWNFSSSGGGSPASGFVKRTITYDTSLLYAPPPYFPTTGEVDIISWTETDSP